MKTIIIIQARMGSTRLPGKHLKQVLGRPLISFLIERLKRVKNQDGIVLATTTRSIDDPLVKFAQEAQIDTFRGNEDDVLDRYFQAAKQYHADVIVRISGDCPLIDPAIVDQIIHFFLTSKPPCDYAANTLVRRYPRGMDTEVFSFNALEKAAIEATKPEDREHVTPYFYFHPELFILGSVENKQDLSHFRWTVDTQEDLTLVKTVLESIYPVNPQFTLDDLVELFKRHPEWLSINAHIQQKPVKGPHGT